SPDRSRLALYFAASPVQKTVRTLTINSTAPPGPDADRLKTSYPIEETTELLAIRPLLFPFGQSVEATAHRPDGTTEVLIWARAHRFDWQPSYYFKRPVALPKGSRLVITTYLDRSESGSRSAARPVCELTVARSTPR
ncbi:MAG TPA: hypothetical protein VJ302_26355, partial [Blastocatellia bacterium]|nr:hypothetical protein [Blastocatellia bacterium]